MPQRLKRRDVSSRGVKGIRLKDGRHVARWTDPITKKPKQQSLDALGLTNNAARLEWRRKKKAELDKIRQAMSTGSGIVVTSSVENAIERYLNYRPRAEATSLALRRDLEAWGDWLAKQGVKELTGLTVEWLQVYRDHVVAPADTRKLSTKLRGLKAVKAFLRRAIRWKMTPRLSVGDLDELTDDLVARRPDVVVLKPKQVRAWLSACVDHEPAYAPFAAGLILTACRFDELRGLSWAEVNLEEREIVLESSRTKTRRSRIITLDESPTMVQILNALLQQGRDRPFFADGTIRSTASSDFGKLADRLAKEHGAVRLTAKVFRSTTESVLMNAPAIYRSAAATRATLRTGNSITVAEARYLDLMRDLPADATTIEDALGIRDLCERVADYVRGGGKCR